MNLADAIRRAALANGEPVLPTPTPTELPPVYGHATAISGGTPAQETNPMDTFDATPEAVRPPDPPSPPVAGGSVVRLELFLSPEQLNGLFRGVVATQHTVMTLREAANMLRISPATLEQMAQDRQIPALHIDGKWRFSKASVDEWLSLRSAERSA